MKNQAKSLTLRRLKSAETIPSLFVCLRDGVDLLPVETCESLIAESRDWSGCGPDAAARAAKILVGSYPARQMTDAEIYTRAIVSVLAEAPAWACSEAVDNLTRNQKFLPTRAEVVSELQKIRARGGKIASEARRHLEEWSRRLAAPPSPGNRPSSDEVSAIVGRTIKAMGCGREKRR